MPMPPTPPLLRELLIGVAQVGVKAVARAVDSVLEDVQDVAEAAGVRIRKGRKNLRVYDRPKKPRPQPSNEEEE